MMGFLQKLMGKHQAIVLDKVVHDKDTFWAWFQTQAEAFHHAVITQEKIDTDFFDPLSANLDRMHEGIYFLAGEAETGVAELILTADGVYRNFAFIEDLVVAAPKLPAWRFVALKPACAIDGFGINMNGLIYSDDTLHFYVREDAKCPQVVDVVMVHSDATATEEQLTSGVYVYLDNLLGEWVAVTQIDQMQIINQQQLPANQTLQPMAELAPYLHSRHEAWQKAYGGVYYNSDQDEFASFEGEADNGQLIVGIIDSTLLAWPHKPSHPWMLTLRIAYDGSGLNGMPSKQIYQRMEAFEDALMAELPEHEGYLNVGRETGDDIRFIYFACKQFVQATRVLERLMPQFSQEMDISYDVFQDKYWQSLQRFEHLSSAED